MAFLTSREFWLSTAERALKTLAQTTLAFIGADSFNVMDPDLKSYVLLCVVPALISVLTSVGSGAAPVGPEGSPSLTKSV